MGPGSNQYSDTITMQVHGAVPVPVGRYIEINIFYSTNGSGLFGTGSTKPLYEYPLIRDWETGIQYDDISQFYDLNHTYKDNRLFDVTLMPLENLQEYSR